MPHTFAIWRRWFGAIGKSRPRHQDEHAAHSRPRNAHAAKISRSGPRRLALELDVALLRYLPLHLGEFHDSRDTHFDCPAVERVFRNQKVRAGGITGKGYRGARKPTANPTVLRRMPGRSGWKHSAGPPGPSPTTGQYLNGGYGWLEVQSRRCETRASLPLDAIRCPRDTPIWKLERRCNRPGTPHPQYILLGNGYPRCLTLNRFLEE